jgi:hypothetical protein
MPKTLPKVYYGLHFYPGVAEYREQGSEAYRIYIGEDTIKNMGPTFAGKPVYVQHVENVDLDKLQEESDGYIMESFYNKADGKHWAKFIIVSDRGHEAIRNGWKLSNAYVPKNMGQGGLHNGVEYDKEILSGEYEHMAIVPNPRYEESIVLTPEEFKTYNSNKELELSKLANSKEKPKGEKSMNLNFFKKSKVENAADLEGTSVVLPKSKIEKTITQLVNEADEHELKKKEPQMANGEHMVKVGEEQMSVNDLVEKYNAMMKKENEDESDKDAHKVEEKGEGELKANDEDEEAKKKALELAKHEDKEIADKKKQNHFEDLKKAPHAAMKNEGSIDLGEDKVARGKARYGSSN